MLLLITQKLKKRKATPPSSPAKPSFLVCWRKGFPGLQYTTEKLPLKTNTQTSQLLIYHCSQKTELIIFLIASVKYRTDTEMITCNSNLQNIQCQIQFYSSTLPLITANCEYSPKKKVPPNSCISFRSCFAPSAQWEISGGSSPQKGSLDLGEQICSFWQQHSQYQCRFTWRVARANGIMIKDREIY